MQKYLVSVLLKMTTVIIKSDTLTWYIPVTINVPVIKSCTLLVVSLGCEPANFPNFHRKLSSVQLVIRVIIWHDQPHALRAFPDVLLNFNDHKMKVTAYSIKACEKEFITRANNKAHDITLISNRLTVDTISYAKGKDAVLVFPGDDLSEQILLDLKLMGVKYIVTRSTSTDHINLQAAESLGLLVANIPSYSPESVAEHALALMLALSRNILIAHYQMLDYDFSLDRLVGTTIRHKIVGVVGLGQTGRAVVEILKGFGCRILVADIRDVADECKEIGVQKVELGVLFNESDIITFHVPLTKDTRHMVNAKSISKMKNGVMLINVSRGAVFKSIDVYNALQQDKISKLGMDVYEFESHVFYFNHKSRPVDDQLLNALIEHPNVLLTPHEAFLTKEALEIVAKRTIQNLNQFHGEGGKS